MANKTFGTENLRVSYDTETFAFTVTCGGRTFSTLAGEEPWFAVGDKHVAFREAASIVTEDYPTGVGDGVLTTFSGFPGSDLSFALYLWVSVADDRLHAEWVPLAEGENVTEVAWPQPIDSFDPEGGYTVLNLMNGKILYDRSEEEVHPVMSRRMLGREAYMPFWGQVSFGGGYVAIVDTPWDASYQYDHMPASRTAVGIRWIPSLAKMDYRRKMTYKFYEKDADYVAFCKVYRQDVKEHGRLVTLAEKAEKNPLVNQMFGTAIIHTPFVCKHIEPRSHYYDKEHPEKNTQVIPFSEIAARLEATKARGLDHAYVHIDGWGRRGYDNQHPDATPPSEEAGGWDGMRDMVERIRAIGYIPAIHDNYRDYYNDAPTFNENQAKRNPDGTYENCHIWFGGDQLILCADLAQGYLRRNFTALADHGCLPDGAYLDVFSVVELDECANPMHRMTRRECVEKRTDCFDYVRSRGMIISSEEPIDELVAHLDLVHHAPDFWGKMRGVAVPLFELVYHDCVLIPMALGRGASCPKERLGFLYALLQGNPPYVSLDAQEDEIARVAIIRRLHKEVAKSELVSHRLLDAEGVEQESRFACGVTVKVNFADDSYAITWQDGTKSEGKVG